MKLFPDRELTAIVNPLGAEVEDDAGDLKSMGAEALNDQFKEDALWIRGKILEDTPAKQIWSRKINGPIIAFLLNEYIAEINEPGSTIHFSQSWEFFMESKLEQIYQSSIKKIDRKIRHHIWGDAENDEPASEDEDSSVKEVHEKLPLQMMDVMFIFDKLRTDVMDQFKELLSLANTNEERNNITRKMVEVEQDPQQRFRPFDQKNKQEAKKVLEDLDGKMFSNINAGTKKSKNDLKVYSLGIEFKDYLGGMEESEEWAKITDSEQTEFLLSQLPNHVGTIADRLTKTLLNKDELNQDLVKAQEMKKEVEDKIQAQKEQRKKIKDELKNT